MIHRFWCGWTKRQDAEQYEAFLRNEVFVSIRKRNVSGLSRINLLRRDGDEESEFLVMMVFDSIEDVVAFAGSDYEAAYVPEGARQFLVKYDARAKHYESRLEA